MTSGDVPTAREWPCCAVGLVRRSAAGTLSRREPAPRRARMVSVQRQPARERSARALFLDRRLTPLEQCMAGVPPSAQRRWVTAFPPTTRSAPIWRPCSGVAQARTKLRRALTLLRLTRWLSLGTVATRSEDRPHPGQSHTCARRTAVALRGDVFRCRLPRPR